MMRMWEGGGKLGRGILDGLDTLGGLGEGENGIDSLIKGAKGEQSKWKDI